MADRRFRPTRYRQQHSSLAKTHDLSVNSIGNSGLVETALDEIAEVLRQRWRQPVIEATRGDLLVGCRVVATSKPSECSALACGEAEHERPHEDWNLELPLSFDHAEFLGVLCEHPRSKKHSEPTHNS